MIKSTIDDVKIRPAIDYAIPEILEIESLAFAGEENPYRSLTFDEIRSLLNETGTAFVGLIARIENGRSDDILGWALYQPGGRAILDRVAVHPSCWNRGIGRKLVESIISRSTEVEVSIDTDDTDSERFFESLGFIESGTSIAYGQSVRKYLFVQWRQS